MGGVSLKMMLQTGEATRESWGKEWISEFALWWEIDWENFQLEYPWVEGDAEQWKERLARALAPTFAHPAGAAE